MLIALLFFNRVQSINGVFGLKDETSVMTQLYQRDKANAWCGQISEATVKGLSKLNKPFKYVVTVVIQQNTGAGIQTAG